MSLQLVSNVLLGLVLVGFLAFRQLRWRRIDRTSVWRLPAILAVIGLVTLGSEAKNITVSTLDVGLIALELVFSIGLGLIMGRLTTFRVASSPDSKGRLIEARAGGVGAALWLALIAVRVGVDVLGGVLGAHLLTATGVILLTVAANRAASALMMDSRLPQVSTRRA